MLCSLTARHEAFPLATPFRISRGIKTVADVVTVEISDGKYSGRGEGVPYAHYGETVAGALEEIARIANDVASGMNRDILREVMTPGAARNAVDCALWDLEAQRKGESVPQMLGLQATGPTDTAMTIGLGTIDAMHEAARKLVSAPLIKIKVDALSPAAQIRAVRAAAPGPRLIVDPNESWNFALVRELQQLLREERVDLLEQPLPAGEDQLLEGFVPLVPIAADESVHTIRDLPRLAARYQVVNIKLDKTGGLTEALALADEAERLGLRLMVGSMICTSLSIAPALILAQRCDFVDLDGPLWLARDRQSGFTGTNGTLSASRSGLWGHPA